MLSNITNDLPAPVERDIELVSGFIYGMVSENHLAELELCYTDSKGSFTMINKVIDDFMSGDTETAMSGIGDFMDSLNQDIADCKATSEDMAAIMDWAMIFKDKKHLVEIAGKHAIAHKKELTANIATLRSDWANAQYFQAGDIMADLLTILVGPIEKKSVEVDMTLMAIPDFVAGFLFGFTGDNHLVEVEACYAGAKLEVVDFSDALSAFEAGDMVKAIKLTKKALDDIQTDLAPCTEMQDDVKALEEWEQSIFSSPAAAVKDALKHYALHKKAIKSDIAQTKLDWANADYFKAGIDTADAVTLLFGKVEAEEAENFEVVSVPEFVAGFMYGMTGDNHLEEIEACFQGSEEMYNEIDTAIKDFELAGWDNITQGVLEVGIAILQFPQALSTCEGMDDDIQALEEWAAIFKSPTELTATLSKNYILHRKEIKHDVACTMTDWDYQEYEKSGEDFAALLTAAIGPIY